MRSKFCSFATLYIARSFVVLGAACRGGRVRWFLLIYLLSNCENTRLQAAEDLLGATRAMSYGSSPGISVFFPECGFKRFRH
ncbi:protein of unknown function [Methylocaldum szegediense]|uniref:Secreted protein n=1 Tax=Methylocaldum szegediense TaxID=73780 RepID=A0ABM9I795_9GAMM|nr:protein of unknown function [Methylocaldum szegediense]